MIIDCISDLHGHYPDLEGGDLLIVAGDWTLTDRPSEYNRFASWIKDQLYRKCIVVAGNHDNWAQSAPFSVKTMQEIGSFEYLFDSGTEFSYHIEGFPEEDEKFLPSGKRTLKIWGSPWTKTFEGMNPKCKAFTVDGDEKLAEKWALIPEDVDILVTHCPPFGTLDYVEKPLKNGSLRVYLGSQSLSDRLLKLKSLKLHVFGHVHYAYGQEHDMYIAKDAFDPDPVPAGKLSVNASHVNEVYDPVNKPIRVIL